MCISGRSRFQLPCLCQTLHRALAQGAPRHRNRTRWLVYIYCAYMSMYVCMYVCIYIYIYEPLMTYIHSICIWVYTHRFQSSNLLLRPPLTLRIVSDYRRVGGGRSKGHQLLLRLWPSELPHIYMSIYVFMCVCMHMYVCVCLCCVCMSLRWLIYTLYVYYIYMIECVFVCVCTQKH